MKNRVLALAAVAMALASVASASADTFDFQFDAPGLTPGNPVVPPIVGTGTMTFANDPGNGTFAFSTLGAYTLNFSFTDGDTFNQTELSSTLSEMEVILSGSGATRRIQFTDDGPGITGAGGSQAGSLDLDTSSTDLTFEPAYFGPTADLYQENGGSAGLQQGNYIGLEDPADFSAPDATSTLALLGLSGLALALASRRLKQAAC